MIDIQAFLSLDTSKFTKGISDAQAKTAEFTRQSSNLGQSMRRLTVRLGAMGAAVFGTITAATGAVMRLNSSITLAATQAGVAASEFAKWEAVAARADVGATELGKAIFNLSAKLNEGQKGFSNLIARIGLDVNKLKGMAPEEAFKQVLGALSSLEAKAKADILKGIFGISGIRMAKLAAMSVDDVNEALARMDRLGIGALDQWALADLGDELGTLRRTITITVAGLLGLLTPLEEGKSVATSYTETLTAITDAFGRFNQMLRNHQTIIGLAVKGLMALAIVAVIVATVFGVIGKVLAFLFSPITALIGVVGALFTAFKVGHAMALAPLIKDMGTLGTVLARVSSGFGLMELQFATMFPKMAASIGFLVRLLVSAFSILGLIVKVTAVILVVVAKMALVATAIGAVILGVVAIIYYWDEIVDAIGVAWELTKSFGRWLADFFGALWQKVGDVFSAIGRFVGLTGDTTIEASRSVIYNTSVNTSRQEALLEQSIAIQKSQLETQKGQRQDNRRPVRLQPAGAY